MTCKTFKIVALAATTVVVGLASPATAAVFLDFTSSSIGTSDTTDLATGIGGITYDVLGAPGSLVDSEHWNNVGCTGSGWDFACDAVGNDYDIGFGVSGNNGNEVDGDITNDEYVDIVFTDFVKLLGVAGMLTYQRNDSDEKETVELYYSTDGGTNFAMVGEADPLSEVNSSGANFDTVGLAKLDGLSLTVNAVRFKAGGISRYDDGNTNITVAGLKIAAVPLPAGVLLLGLGLAGMGGARVMQRRRKDA